MSAYNYTLHFNDDISGKGENYFSFKVDEHNDEHWYFETSYHIADTVKLVFSDLINNTHFDHPDIERFLTTKGTIVSECITTKIDDKFVIPKPEVFKKSKIGIFCIYFNDNANTHEEAFKIFQSVVDSIGMEDNILFGLIGNGKIAENSVTINMIAMCNSG
jgi:hypothetical protein